MHPGAVEVAVVVGVEVVAVAAVVGEVTEVLISQLRILTRSWKATMPTLTPCKLSGETAKFVT